MLCVIATSFTGCFGRKKSGEAFSMPIMDEPTSLDPQIADSNSEKLVAANCYEGLVRIMADGTIGKGVATDWNISDDGLTYTFKLRNNSHWAMFSGHKAVLGENYEDTFDITVKAEDFKFGIERTLSEQTGSADAPLFSAVKSISTPDDFTIVFNLSYADDNFLYALTNPGAMPCDEEFFNLTNGKYGLDAKYLLCNGPFHVSKWTEKTSVKLAKNNEYNGESSVSPSSVTFYINNDDSEVADKMNSVTYDVAFLSSSQFSSIENKKDLNSVAVQNVTYSFIFNQNDNNYRNKNMRLAFCRSCDTSSLFDSQSDISKADGIVPPSCKIGGEDYRNGNAAELLSYDETLAKKNFNDALLELGSSSVETTILCTEQYEPFVKQMVQKLQKTLGVKFVSTVKVVSESDLEAAVNDGNYSVAFYPFKAKSSFAGEIIEGFDQSNIFGYESDVLSQKIRNIKNNSGSLEGERSAVAYAENYLVSEAVIMPVFYENSYFVTSKKTSGIYFYSSADNVCFINAKKS